MFRELLGVSRATAPLCNQRLEARCSHLHTAELRRNKEAVHKDQKSNEQYVKQCGQYVHERFPPLEMDNAVPRTQARGNRTSSISMRAASALSLSISRSSTSEMTAPALPARAVRPARWR